MSEQKENKAETKPVENKPAPKEQKKVHKDVSVARDLMREAFLKVGFSPSGIKS